MIEGIPPEVMALIVLKTIAFAMILFMILSIPFIHSKPP